MKFCKIYNLNIKIIYRNLLAKIKQILMLFKINKLAKLHIKKQYKIF